MIIIKDIAPDALHYYTLAMIEYPSSESQRRVSGATLQEQFDLLSTAVAHLPVNLFGFNQDGIVTLVGGRMMLDLGLEKGSIMGQSIFTLYAQNREFLNDARVVLATGEVIRRERPFMGHSFDTYLIPFRDSQGVVVGAVGVGINITDRVRLQEALLEHERLRVALQKEHELSLVKDQIMARLSHEFRNPLAVIQMSAEMLEKHAERLSPEARAARFEQIHGQIAHLTRILDDLSFSVRHSSGYDLLDVRFSTFDLRALCDEVIEEVKGRLGAEHHLDFTFTGDLTAIYSAPRLVRVILVQLLSNAFKYSARGSQVRLEVHVGDGGQGRGDGLLLSVRDQGIGIAEADREHLFTPFYRGKNFDERPGLGLGLSMAREAAELLGGTVTFSSAPDTGTTFVVWLPAPQPAKSGDASAFPPS
jgi:signal transduction histidine kinase